MQGGDFTSFGQPTRLITCAMAMMSNVHEVQTVYDVVQDPQMVLLSEKGVHGVSVRCEKVGMLLPQTSQGGTLKNHMNFIASSTTVASQTTLSALSTWPVPANRPVAIGKP